MEHDGERITVGDRVVIYRRGRKQIWTAEFSEAGVHHRKSLHTRNKGVALEQATALAGQLQAGTLSRTPPATTILEAANDYISYLETENRARRTITRYRGELAVFGEFAAGIGIRRLGQVTMASMDKYRAHRMKDHNPATVYHETVVIKQLLKWAVRRRLIASNPIAEYELNKPRRPEKRALTLAQVNAILAQCNTRRRQVEVAMLAFTGMRSGEMQGLRREDVDLDGGWIHIGRQVDGPTKTLGSVRDVPIHPRLLGLLRTLSQHGHEFYLTAEPSRRYPNGGRPINTKKLNEYFKAAAARAGIRGFTVHGLRHFFKTHCINNKVPREIVDRWQGHADGSVSGGYYHLQREESQKQMNRIPFGDDEELGRGQDGPGYTI